MSESVAFYQQQAKQTRSVSPLLLHLQQEAEARFVTNGFPGRRHEAWKYTPLDAFTQHRFHAQRSFEKALEKSEPAPSTPFACTSYVLMNGALAPCEEKPSLPEGVLVLPLWVALEQCPEKVTPYLGAIMQPEHAFHDLNTLFLLQGMFIYVPKNTSLSAPLWLTHFQNQNDQAVYLRHVVVLEEGSQLEFIEDYRGEPSACYFTNSITEVMLFCGAQLTHTKIQRESKRAYHVGHLAVKQEARSVFKSHSISSGGAMVRSDTNVVLHAPHSSCLLNGVYCVSQGQHVDHHTLVHHSAAQCQSIEDYRGILDGQSRAVFNGRVLVAKGAQQSQAKQNNKNLLLSAHSEVDTKPQLEIFADDVSCSHGATVGQLDEDALFYLATRGISREEASRYLQKAFIAENLRAIELKELSRYIEQHLGQSDESC